MEGGGGGKEKYPGKKIPTFSGRGHKYVSDTSKPGIRKGGKIKKNNRGGSFRYS